MPLSSLPTIEIDFFNSIKSKIKILFDIGSREDVDYLKNSMDSSGSFIYLKLIRSF